MLQKLKKRLQNALGVSALTEKVEKLSIETKIAAGFSRGAAGTRICQWVGFACCDPSP
jgi:hypothetical protein